MRNILKAFTIIGSFHIIPVCCRSWIAWSFNGEGGVAWKTRGAVVAGGSEAPSVNSERLKESRAMSAVDGIAGTKSGL
jgi:hypothetical protein